MKFVKWVNIVTRFWRWLLSGIVGVVMLLADIIILLSDTLTGNTKIITSILLLVFGVAFLFFCSKKILFALINVYSQSNVPTPSNINEIGDFLYKRKVLEMGPKIVAVGGGTGISTMLRGLKKYSSNITAIITVADDGGGSGVLRKDLKMLPPGDIRNCLLALAETEPVMEQLLQYRFKEGSLKNQSFGNLFLAAMNGICGSFEKAIKSMSDVLAVKGRVLPVTEENIELYARMEDGSEIVGESEIGKSTKSGSKKIRNVYYKKTNIKPLDQTIKAINEADLIVLGPGSLYTSIIPNLLVDNVSSTIKKSKAKKVYVCNIMTQPGETDDYSALDHINAIESHSKDELVEYVISNNGLLPPNILKRYNEDGAFLVKTDYEQINKRGKKIISDNLIKIDNEVVRHNADKLASLIIDLI